MAKRAWKTCFQCGHQFRGTGGQITCTRCNSPVVTNRPIYGGKEPASEQWVERHEVMSSDLERTYIVARHRDGHWACSCPVWKFRRQQCKHIDEVLRRPSRASASKGGAP